MATKKGKAERKSRQLVNRLQTQKDGRLFAVEVLDRLQNANADDTSAYPFENPEVDERDGLVPYRKGPQWDGFYKDLSRLKAGTDEALKGFASIVSDALAHDIGMSLSFYRELEDAGLFLDFGTPGTKYPKPRLRTAKEIAERKAKQDAEYRAWQEQQKKDDKKKLVKARPYPLARTIDEGEPEAIEEFLERNGIARRVASAFLTKPYEQMAAGVKKDKNAAIGFAQAVAALEQSKENYMTIWTYLRDAENNMKAAILSRKDGRRLLEQARKGASHGK